MSGESGGTEQMRERILEAGLAEFAAYGLAGARVDRIATTASVNKNSIYRYFPSKEELFAAVLHRHMERVLTDVRFTPDDLPGFAMRLFDYALDHPQLMRLVTWSGLERPSPAGKRVPSMGDKFTRISELQAAGKLADDVSPAVIFTIITAIGTAWTTVNPFTSLIDPDALDDREALRTSIGRLVERALAAHKPQHETGPVSSGRRSQVGALPRLTDGRASAARSCHAPAGKGQDLASARSLFSSQVVGAIRPDHRLGAVARPVQEAWGRAIRAARQPIRSA